MGALPVILELVGFLIHYAPGEIDRWSSYLSKVDDLRAAGRDPNADEWADLLRDIRTDAIAIHQRADEARALLSTQEA